MMAKGVQTCPICGTQFASLSGPGPCSSKCAATQRQRGAMGTQQPDAEPRWGTGPDRRGKSKGPGPVPKKSGGWCSVVLLPPAAAGVAAVLALHRRRSR